MVSTLSGENLSLNLRGGKEGKKSGNERAVSSSFLPQPLQLLERDLELTERGSD